MLIVSYETFRLHAEKFRGEGACDLLICDEAHRLKNDQTLTNKARRSAQKPSTTACQGLCGTRTAAIEMQC